MDDTLISHFLLKLHPTVLYQIWYNSTTFQSQEFLFLDMDALRKELKTQYLVEQLCIQHKLEQKNTFPKFLRRWNLYHLFDTDVSTEYRLLHLHQWLQDYEKVTLKPFLWKPADCVIAVDHCIHKGKRYSLSYLNCRGINLYYALMDAVKRGVRLQDYSFVWQVFTDYKLWQSKPHVLVVSKRVVNKDIREYFEKKIVDFISFTERQEIETYHYKRGLCEEVSNCDNFIHLRAGRTCCKCTNKQVDMDIKSAYLLLGMEDKLNQTDEELKRDAQTYGFYFDEELNAPYYVEAGRWELAARYLPMNDLLHDLEWDVEPKHFPALKYIHLMKKLVAVHNYTLFIEYHRKECKTLPYNLIEEFPSDYTTGVLYKAWQMYGFKGVPRRLIRACRARLDGYSDYVKCYFAFYINWLEQL